MKHIRLENGSPKEHRLIARAVMVCLCLAVLDQITKDMVVEGIRKFDRIQVIPGFFDLTHVTNPGAAWGMLSHKGILLLSFSMTVLLLMVIFFRKLCDGWTERYYALALVVSGILGNSYDRIFRSSYGNLCDGEVVDFLSFHIGDIPWAVWPSFNVADSCICVGMAILVISSFIRPEKKKTESQADGH